MTEFSCLPESTLVFDSTWFSVPGYSISLNQPIPLLYVLPFEIYFNVLHVCHKNLMCECDELWLKRNAWPPPTIKCRWANTMVQCIPMGSGFPLRTLGSKSKTFNSNPNVKALPSPLPSHPGSSLMTKHGPLAFCKLREDGSSWMSGSKADLLVLRRIVREGRAWWICAKPYITHHYAMLSMSWKVSSPHIEYPHYSPSFF